MGAFLGYHVTVCDARPVFATTSRFPEADEVVVDWPHRYLAAEQAAGRIDERTVLAVLTHDPKFDVPLLEVALRLPEVAYVGAMGSRRTHDDRIARLLEAGLDEKEIARLSSPIGLDLGARTPEETAISIAAEIIAGRWGGSGERLGSTDGRIHRDLNTRRWGGARGRRQRVCSCSRRCSRWSGAAPTWRRPRTPPPPPQRPPPRARGPGPRPERADPSAARPRRTRRCPARPGVSLPGLMREKFRAAGSPQVRWWPRPTPTSAPR